MKTEAQNVLSPLSSGKEEGVTEAGCVLGAQPGRHTDA